ncbi:alanine racemase [uncultured Lentibacter sp.]|uniref:alanine racemase n=1 Tax=uncultured Lentibacter sp. TaxID=1659309 RepID=UPI00261574CC|nr:alanine racemase [uncultured Lentibacter sp.]
MASGTLTIDLDALVHNWRALAKAPETGAVVKADAYGLGLAPVAHALAKAGARSFFVATAEEGAALRDTLGQGPVIYIFSGHMAGDTPLINSRTLTPLLNSPDQLERQLSALPDAPFGLQLDTGMNRLGMEPAEWAALRDRLLSKSPALVMSHLAAADEPHAPMNAAQLKVFRALTEGLTAPRSLAATGGTLLGRDYHFDMTRPGIGLYGGAPFTQARPVVRLELPVVQTRTVAPGESVGYNRGYVARQPRRVATLAAGYADGLIRAMSGKATLYSGPNSCPLIGRVSMDLITVDITDLPDTPDSLTLLGPQQGVDTLAQAAGTIGYEVLTSLGARYSRRYTGAGAGAGA